MIYFQTHRISTCILPIDVMPHQRTKQIDCLLLSASFIGHRFYTPIGLGVHSPSHFFHPIVHISDCSFILNIFSDSNRFLKCCTSSSTSSTFEGRVEDISWRDSSVTQLTTSKG